MEWYFHLIFGLLSGLAFFVGLICTLGTRAMFQDYKDYGDKTLVGASIMMLVLAASMFFLSAVVMYGAIFGIE